MTSCLVHRFHFQNKKQKTLIPCSTITGAFYFFLKLKLDAPGAKINFAFATGAFLILLAFQHCLLFIFSNMLNYSASHMSFFLFEQLCWQQLLLKARLKVINLADSHSSILMDNSHPRGTQCFITALSLIILFLMFLLTVNWYFIHR